MVSVYSLIPRLKNPAINAGEPIEIEVFISGYGTYSDIKDNKFLISYSSPKLFKRDENNRIGFLESSMKVEKDKNGKIVGVLTGSGEYKDSKTGEMQKDYSTPLSRPSWIEDQIN